MFRQVRSTIMISGRQCSGAQWFHLVFSDLSKSFLQPSFHNLAFQIFSAAIFSQFGFSHISKSFLQPSFHSLSYHSFLNVFCIYPTFPELLTHTLFSLSLFFRISGLLFECLTLRELEHEHECGFISPYTSQGIYIHRSWRAILKSKCDIFVKFWRKKSRYLFSSLLASPPL